MDIIKEELGKRLSVQEVATIFGVDERLVRQHYNELSGMRLGSRVYIFFEKEVINAYKDKSSTKNPWIGQIKINGKKVKHRCATRKEALEWEVKERNRLLSSPMELIRTASLLEWANSIS